MVIVQMGLELVQGPDDGARFSVEIVGFSAFCEELGNSLWQSARRKWRALKVFVVVVVRVMRFMSVRLHSGVRLALVLVNI